MFFCCARVCEGAPAPCEVRGRVARQNLVITHFVGYQGHTLPSRSAAARRRSHQAHHASQAWVASRSSTRSAAPRAPHTHALASTTMVSVICVQRTC